MCSTVATLVKTFRNMHGHVLIFYATILSLRITVNRSSQDMDVEKLRVGSFETVELDCK